MPDILPTSELTFLEWDSEFFGRKVGRINISKTAPYPLDFILETARRQHYELLYAFVDAGMSISDEALSTPRGLFVDCKTVFEHVLSPLASTPSSFVRRLTAGDDLDRIYNLAYQSGEFSRFRIDPAIGRENFQRLYRRWVDNSITGAVADVVMVYEAKDSLIGFVTLKITGHTGVIGLIAADTNHRGQGVGTSLMNHVKAYAAEAGLDRLEVVTQGLNVGACQFYEKNQFSRKSETSVYHFWL
ncbi:GNAT family N-acetyltransferase [Nostoc sp. CHAB 5834]|nr:GNAT family N-acetyltransferase [Nostoc sp. CHAB 5834]